MFYTFAGVPPWAGRQPTGTSTIALVGFARCFTQVTHPVGRVRMVLATDSAKLFS